MDRRAFELSWMGFGPVREALVDRAGPAIDVVPLLRDVGGGIEPRLVVDIAAKLRRLRPDVMHIHNWSTSLYGIAAARLAGVPMVVYGLGGKESPEAPPPRRRRAMRALSPHVDRFTAVCGYLAEQIADEWAVDRARVTVLRTGIDLKTIDSAPDAAAVRAELGLPPDANVVGAVSVLRPVKRIGDLIAAMGMLSARHPRSHLVIAGNPLGVAPEELRQQAEAAGLGDRFHLLGRVERPSQLLPAFDVFVNCSIFEGTSNAILEAMAARIAVVGTAVGGTPELLDDGVEGQLVPPESPAMLAAALDDYLTDPDRRRAAGEAGRRRIEATHTFEAMLAAYLSFYEDAGRQADLQRNRRGRSVAATLASLRRLAAG